MYSSCLSVGDLSTFGSFPKGFAMMVSRIPMTARSVHSSVVMG